MNDSLVAFAPIRAVLENAVDRLAELGERGGGGIETKVRRAAFAAHERALSALRLPYEELWWLSGRRSVPTMPILASLSDEEIDRPALALENAGGLVHLGATLLQAPPSARDDARITVLPLADAVRAFPERVASARLPFARRRLDRYGAMATAFQNCGAFIDVPDGVELDAPIQLGWIYGEARAEAVFPLIVVRLGKGARATVIERHVGEGDAFACGLVGVNAEDGACLEYVTVQRAGHGVRLRMTRVAHCARDASVGWHLAELGGAHARTLLESRLDAPGARTEIAALSFGIGTQRAELTTAVDHRRERTASNVVVRCAASDRARAKYGGLAHLRAAAHGGDASLRADALVLSRRARIEAKPELEMRVHDASAFQGATVGSLDEDALFYVSTRGVPRAEAVRMIALAFFEPAVSCFPGEALRDEVRTALDQHIEEAAALTVS